MSGKPRSPRRSAGAQRALGARAVALVALLLSRALSTLTTLRWRLRGRSLDERLAEELAHHRSLLAARGSDRVLADDENLRRQCRAVYRHPPAPSRGDPAMLPSLGELRAVARNLLRTPLFTLSSMAILALGTGAAVTLFGVVHAVLLQPLPYPEPERLARVWSINGDNRFANHNPLDLADYAAGANGVEAVAALSRGSMTWSPDPGSPTGARRVEATSATPGWLELLGVEPALGRGFTRDESLPGNAAVVVLTHRFWRDHLGEDARIVGRALLLDDLPHTVVGVLPESFVHPLAWDSHALIRPLALDPQNTSRGGHYAQAIARLASDATFDRAEAEIQQIATELEALHPTTNRARSAWLVPLRDGVVGDVRALLILLSCSVGVLLLITAANVGAIFLARTLGRREELALRAALGAGRARLLSTVAFEGLLLSLLGTACGVALAWALRDLASGLGLARLPWGRTFEIDSATLGFALALALFTALTLSLPAMLRGSARRGGRGAGPGDDRRSGGSRRATRQRRALVTCQVALAVVLLVTAGLLTESLDRLLAVNAGFDRAAVTTAQVALPWDRYEPRERLAFFESLRQRMTGEGAASDVAPEARDGIAAFGLVNRLPLSNAYSCDSFVAGGRELPEPGAEDCAEDRVVDRGYFEAMGIPLLEGRGFLPTDRDDQPTVVVVNEALARRYWPAQSAVGQQLRWGGPSSDTPWLEIVGVVADVRHFGLDGEIRPEIYTHQPQNPWPAELWVTLRTERPEAAIGWLRGAVAELDPTVPVFDVRTMEERVLDSVESERLRSLLLRLFAGAALLLTAVGLWGLIAYATAQARRELGVRLALGADRRRILRWVLAQGLRPVLTGAVLGAAGGWIAGRLLAGQLFQVPALHPPTLIGAVALLLAVGIASTLAPSARATRLDPVEALRDE